MSQIKLKHSGGNSSIIAAPSSNPASDVTFRLPNADGSAGQFMKTDGSGNLSFDAAGGTTINSNADNRVITGSGTANTLNAESNVVIDANGNLGIGETSPLGKIHAKSADSGGSAAAYADELVLEGSGDSGMTILSGNASDGSLNFGDDGNNVVGRIVYNHNTNTMQIRANGLNPGYELRSDSKSFFNVVNSNLTIDKNNTGIITNFVYSGNSVGTITISGSSTAYNTSSDYRLKENVVALTDGITRLKTLKPYRFNFILDKDKTVDGFLAHEVTAVPEAITGTKDEVDADNNPIYQGIDQSKLVPLLTAALQEAVAKIELLETKVAALEAA